MKNLSIVALSVVAMLSGCAGYTSRTFQIKQPQVDDSAVKTATKEQINIQKAAEIAREVLEEKKYSITHFEWKACHYACVRARKRVCIDEDPLGSWDMHEYKTQVSITTTPHRAHKYEVASYWKFISWLEAVFPELSPSFRWSHRDEKEEQKILDGIEQKYRQP